MTEPIRPSDDKAAWSDAKRNWVLVGLCLVAVMNFADRQILSILIDPIKKTFGASDTEMGMLSGLAFALFYLTAGIPLARLADRKRRATLIAVCLGLWSMMTTLCGVAQSFGQLALARIGVAVGEAGPTPATQSMLADLFPRERRTSALGALTAAQSFGIGVGIFLGGWLNDLLGWRGAFIALGLPGILLAAILLLRMPEPARGMSDRMGADGNPESMWSAVRNILRNPRSRMIFIALAFINFTGYGILTWAPSFFTRNHGLTTTTIGLMMGVCLVSGLALGSLLVGPITDRLARKHYWWTALVPGLGALVTGPSAVAFALFPNIYGALAAFMMFNLAASFIQPPLYSQLLTETRSDRRGTAVFLGTLAQNLVGGALGPLAIGILSDRLTPAHGQMGLAAAIAISATGMLIASLLLFRLTWMTSRIVKPELGNAFA